LMRGVGVTSDCIEALATLPELTHLSLVDSQIDDRFLTNLGRFGKLKDLSVAGSKITDAGLLAIPATVRLEFLSLANTDISEVGLLGMKRAPLKLDLVGTRVRVTEPLYHWFITHKLDTISLDESSLDPESKLAERLRIRIRHLNLTPALPWCLRALVVPPSLPNSFPLRKSCQRGLIPVSLVEDDRS
jgi:hypothetical protein